MLDTLRLTTRILQKAIIIILRFLTAGYFQLPGSAGQPSEPTTMKNIVILGASYAGIKTAHRILKQASKTGLFKITIVSPNSHFYWNMASPRGLLPGKLSDDELFQPIAPGFKQYSATQFEFILASAERLEIEGKKVHITGSGGTKMLDYDYLILATGSRTTGDTPFKGLGTTEATKNGLHGLQARVKNAQIIVVAGGGVTSVEAAGELAFEYEGKKKIILISSGSTILQESPESVSKYAIKELQNLEVDIKLQTKVMSSAQTLDGRQELVLSDEDKLIADLYIPAYGLIPNSSYVPGKYLNANGFVMVDEHLKVKDAEGVWAIGDVTNVEPSQFITCDKQSVYLAKSITSILSNKAPLPYKPATSRFMGLQIGKTAGTGHYGNFKIPSFIVIWARKNLFMDTMGPTVNGSLP
ncbi:Fc.00g002420.m01.CDS01 [Cosmosporella sp. VM-42]